MADGLRLPAWFLAGRTLLKAGSFPPKLMVFSNISGATMSSLGQIVFGRVEFDESEELNGFRFRFLAIVLLSGAVCTGLFLLGEHSRINPINGRHVVSMTVFTGLTLLLWLALRGHKRRFLAVAYAYEFICLLEYVSALMYVPQDELRVLWFLVNIPGVFILLGQRAGTVVMLITVAILALGNQHLSAPYSPNAMATLLTSIVYFAVFFYIYADRSLSYFVRMRDSNRQLRHMATHDTLTQVLNARAYYAGCDHLIRLAARNAAPYAVLFVDLDHFKRINDQHGHAAGDAVLKSVAATLQGSLRESDLLGRIGGEEFSIFLPNTDLEGALKVAESLRQRIEALRPEIGGEERITVTASIGVARNRIGEPSIMAIQQQADQAMYQAKSLGRNRVSCLNEKVATLGLA